LLLNATQGGNFCLSAVVDSIMVQHGFLAAAVLTCTIHSLAELTVVDSGMRKNTWI
jgi:hypothetical protein